MKALALLPHPCSIFPASHHPWRPRFPNRSSRFRFCSSTRYRPSDSNAETFRSQKFNSSSRGREDPEAEDDEQEDFDPSSVRFGSRRKKRRRWWSDEPASELEEEPSGVFEQVIDSVWIFKVFKSYGWTLPPIIISLLLNSGPKAFLMALALPLGQSILSLAFEKLWGTVERRPKRRTRSKTRKRPFYSTESRVQEEEEANESWEEKGKMGVGYQSWEVGSNGEVKKEGRSGTSFGGWEDLDGVGSQRKPSGVRGKKQSTSMERGKLSWREKKSDTPLLLRLLIAVFPFLGSWTRML